MNKKIFNCNIGGEIIEIIIRDFSGKKIELFRFNINDKKNMSRCFNILKNKYNIDFKEKLPDDLDWLR